MKGLVSCVVAGIHWGSWNGVLVSGVATVYNRYPAGKGRKAIKYKSLYSGERFRLVTGT